MLSLNLFLLTEKLLKGRKKIPSDLWLMGKEVIKSVGEKYPVCSILFFAFMAVAWSLQKCSPRSIKGMACLLLKVVPKIIADTL